MAQPLDKKSSSTSVPIVVMGSGRSGTTWVLDSLAGPNRLKTVFEPLNSQCIPQAVNVDSVYIAPGSEVPAAYALLEQILDGKLRSVWANYRINPSRLNPSDGGWKLAAHNFLKLGRHINTYRQPDAKGLAIKFIRANLLLPWICSNFDVRALLVVRHPCAVIASRLALGGPNWQPQSVVEQYCKQQGLMQLLDKHFTAIDPSTLTPAAALAWVWCVENVLPITWANDYKFSVAFYEDLLVTPEQEWARVVADLQLDNMPDAGLLKSPSQQVSKSMQNKTFDSAHVGRWRKKLSEQQLEEINAVLQAFNVQCYHTSDPMPRRAQLNTAQKQ